MIKMNPPIKEVLEMQRSGASKKDIIKNLESKGYSQQDIAEALSQADMKNSVETPDSIPSDAQESALTSDSSPEAPTPPTPDNFADSYNDISRETPYPFAMQQNAPPIQQPIIDRGMIQEFIEQILNEKWQDMMSDMGDFVLWKGRVDDDLSAIKQEVLRFQARVDGLHQALIGKMDSYQRSMSNLGVEMKALEKVFSKILEPLSENIKELKRVTANLKH